MADSEVERLDDPPLDSYVEIHIIERAKLKYVIRAPVGADGTKFSFDEY